MFDNSINNRSVLTLADKFQHNLHGLLALSHFLTFVSIARMLYQTESPQPYVCSRISIFL